MRFALLKNGVAFFQYRRRLFQYRKEKLTFNCRKSSPCAVLDALSILRLLARYTRASFILDLSGSCVLESPFEQVPDDEVRGRFFPGPHRRFPSSRL